MPEALAVVAVWWGSVVPLVLISLAIMGSPGPATISLVAAGSALGLRRSLPYLVGIIIGTVAVLIAVATGITAALIAVPTIGSVLIWISAAYVLRLAYLIATAPSLSDPATPSGAFSLAGGAVLGVANPKAWLAIAAVFASAHVAAGATADATAKVAVLIALIVVICTTWLVAGRAIAPLLHEPRRARLVNAALALLLVAATTLALLH